ncbi:thioredoxin family protein [Texcoconibacillus texcoconensis]|uniref:Thioredoxin-like negative regulator of GroEL n=1 Tax=Texcoconibacillus texcoconensis TaxID=1095777 RepID=A0A840QT48_9BACI|nr:thioredoxin family protein [Texcoconibacillus texcoconensis]MBB5174702.1 thioredoxin-like negative regulator of GroEL [Texcoconibacillus texcoconensis]
MKTWKDRITVEQAISTNEMTLVLVKSKTCTVCEPVEQMVDRLIEKDADVEIGKVYMDEVPDLTGQWLIFSVPTLLLFVKGDEHKRVSRFIREEDIKDMLTYAKEQYKGDLE